jgi:hypothetical protein
VELAAVLLVESDVHVEAKRQTLALAAALARPAAANALSASPPNRANSRETVASDATGPYTPGSQRANATSAKQSPPAATAKAASSRIFAGSWNANGLRHRASACDKAPPSPETRTASVNSAPPARDTERDFPARAQTSG